MNRNFSLTSLLCCIGYQKNGWWMRFMTSITSEICKRYKRHTHTHTLRCEGKESSIGSQSLLQKYPQFWETLPLIFPPKLSILSYFTIAIKLPVLLPHIFHSLNLRPFTSFFSPPPLNAIIGSHIFVS